MAISKASKFSIQVYDAVAQVLGNCKASDAEKEAIGFTIRSLFDAVDIAKEAEAHLQEEFYSAQGEQQ